MDLQNNESAGRKRPAHQPVVETSNRSRIVFVTVCSKGRKAVFDRDAVHDVVVDAWRKADRWLVGQYVLMPDHIHFFCSQLRRGESYGEKWNYVRNNPVRAGLVERSEDWAYQGAIENLRWLEG